MDSLLKQIIDTYRRHKAEKKRIKEYNRVVEQPLNYPILQEFFQQAQIRPGVAVTVKLKDGTNIEIITPDKFDELKLLQSEVRRVW
jgi:hypothetical protein